MGGKGDSWPQPAGGPHSAIGKQEALAPRLPKKKTTSPWWRLSARQGKAACAIVRLLWSAWTDKGSSLGRVAVISRLGLANPAKRLRAAAQNGRRQRLRHLAPIPIGMAWTREEHECRGSRPSHFGHSTVAARLPLPCRGDRSFPKPLRGGPPANLASRFAWKRRDPSIRCGRNKKTKSARKKPFEHILHFRSNN